MPWKHWNHDQQKSKGTVSEPCCDYATLLKSESASRNSSFLHISGNKKCPCVTELKVKKRKERSSWMQEEEPIRELWRLKIKIGSTAWDVKWGWRKSRDPLGKFENTEVETTYNDIKFKGSENAGICNNPDDPLPQLNFKLPPRLHCPTQYISTWTLSWGWNDHS